MIPVILFIVGIAITCVNFYLSWIRVPLINKRQPGAAARSISGVPLIGSAALWLSAWMLPAGSRMIPVALGASLFDTGGLHWFVATMVWRSLSRATDR